MPEVGQLEASIATLKEEIETRKAAVANKEALLANHNPPIFQAVQVCHVLRPTQTQTDLDSHGYIRSVDVWIMLMFCGVCHQCCEVELLYLSGPEVRSGSGNAALDIVVHEKTCRLLHSRLLAAPLVTLRPSANM